MPRLLQTVGASIFAVWLAACAPREILLPAVGIESPKLDDFPADFVSPMSNETDQRMPGFGGGGGGVDQTPVIFVHGNTVSASYWLPNRTYFADKGYALDELWAPSYGWNNVRYFDSADLSVPSLDRFVTAVMDYLSEQRGAPVLQVDVIGHSLGVTLSRQWMRQTNSYHKVRSFIGTAGANDGVWTAAADTRGQQRGVSWELYPGSPWLEQLNFGGETPGPTRYMTLYDGTGWGDVLFPPGSEDSGALDGAYNLAWNRENGTNLGHLEIPRKPGPMDAMIAWLGDADHAPADAQRPRLRKTGTQVTASQRAARVHCSNNGQLPDLNTPGVETVTLNRGVLYTCFARNPETGLASRLRRIKLPAAPDMEHAKPSLALSPAGGVFEQPVNVEMTSDDPDAYIVYSTAGGPLSSGSPLYAAPVFVAGPVTLTAVAVAPGNVRSDPVTVQFDISLELVEARHRLLRQFDPGAPVKYVGERKKGR